jgi:toxin ParE1/3/4
MARIELATKVLQDFERFIDHLLRTGAADAPERIEEIIQALDILTHSPLIGRPVKNGNRELVVGRDARGYVALYRFAEVIDTVFVLAIRSQREAGYRR